MSIRRRLVRTLAAVTLVFAVLAAGLAGLSSWQGYLTVETSEAELDAARALRAIEHEGQQLASLAREWSHSDATLAYVHGDNPGYQPASLKPTTLEVLGLSNLLLVDDAGAVVWSAGRRAGAPGLTRVDPWLVEQSRAGGVLHVGDLGSGGVGTRQLASGPALVTHQPITSATADVPAAGALVMTRALDDAFVAGVADRVQRAVVIERHDPARPANERTGSEVVSRVPLVAEDGVPVATLAVTTPRTVSAVGRSSILTMALTIGAVLLAMGLVTLMAVDRIVVRRLLRLRDDSMAIQHRGGGHVHHDDARDDELTEVTRAVDGMVGSLHRTQQDLELRNAELAELARVRQDLVAVVSHELRTPLTTLLGFARTLEVHGDALDGEQRQHFLARIQVNARHLNRLVGDLLVLSRADDGEVTAVPEDVALAATARGLHADLPVTFTATIPEDVWVRCDPDHLRRMLTNLLENASKYGAAPIEVTALQEGPDTVVVLVRDHGPGVPTEFVPRMFERFTQASTGDQRTARGVGLGLSIVQALAHANGGEARYVAYDDGAAFGVVLPCARVRSPAVPPERTDDAPVGAPRRAGSPDRRGSPAGTGS